ncbi:hypothetical protein F5Y11DRAFT_37707 [Daldinia sp. FL1419]|nr:hypothetical protein F5Y11DRAFT_37707 [Daldinia sp. FL1419]
MGEFNWSSAQGSHEQSISKAYGKTNTVLRVHLPVSLKFLIAIYSDILLRQFRSSRTEFSIFTEYLFRYISCILLFSAFLGRIFIILSLIINKYQDLYYVPPSQQYRIGGSIIGLLTKVASTCKAGNHTAGVFPEKTAQVTLTTRFLRSTMRWTR